MAGKQGTDVAVSRYALMQRTQSGWPPFVIGEAIYAVLLSAVFGEALLLTNALNLGSLVAEPRESGSALIIILGAMTTLAPIFFGCSIAFPNLGRTGDE